jgi:hypothetical protein
MDSKWVTLLGMNWPEITGFRVLLFLMASFRQTLLDLYPLTFNAELSVMMEAVKLI